MKKTFIVVVASFVCLLTACSTTDAGSDQSSGTASQGTAQSAPALKPGQPYGGQPVLWMNKDLKAVSDPVMVAGVAVLYTRDGKQLMLTGLNPADGAVMWSRKASVSATGLSESPTPKSINDKWVAYYSQSDGGDAELAKITLVDPQGNSSEVATSSPKKFVGFPFNCEEPQDYACVWVSQENETRPWRITAGMKDAELDRSQLTQKVPGKSFDVLDTMGLYASGKDKERTLAWLKDNKIVWQVVDKGIFKENMRFTSVTYYHDSKLAIVTLKQEFSDKVKKIPYANSEALVGIETTTGKVLWKKLGYSDDCAVYDGKTDNVPNDPYLACELISGDLVTNNGKTTGKNLKVGLVRLNPLTGDIFWHSEVAKPEISEGKTVPEIYPSGDGIIVSTKEGFVFVNLDNGATHPAPADVVYWAYEHLKYGGTVKGKDDKGNDTFDRQYYLDAPYVDSDNALRITLPVPPSVGAHGDGVVVIATPKGILGYSTK